MKRNRGSSRPGDDSPKQNQHNNIGFSDLYNLCTICKAPIINRGGKYCGRCAALHANRTWDEVRHIRTKECKAKREQTKFNDFCPCNTPNCGGGKC